MPRFRVYGHIPVVFEVAADDKDQAVNQVESEEIHEYDLSKHIDGLIEITSAEEVEKYA